ncbi:MAG: hypothetical protein HUJ30_04475 [Gammaproteobacteria bacterium]|nr:hypothetical protein [Gammaproteobacteria bacterium]
MGKLRKTVQKEVYDSLDDSIFASDDFDVQFGDPDNDEWLVYIEFIHDPNFYYGIGGSGSMGASYYAKKSPGDIQESDFDYYNGFSDAVRAIPLWCKEIRNELKASKPIYKEVDELRQIIEEQFTK